MSDTNELRAAAEEACDAYEHRFANASCGIFGPIDAEMEALRRAVIGSSAAPTAPAAGPQQGEAVAKTLARQIITQHYSDEPSPESLVETAWRILQCHPEDVVNRAIDLNEKARMPYEQALNLAISETSPTQDIKQTVAWRSHDNHGMRYPESCDLSGGETDSQPAPAAGPQQELPYGFESGLVQLLNEARCLSKETVGNRELASRIVRYMRMRGPQPAPAVERGVAEALQVAGLPSLEESAKCDAAQAIFWRNLNGGPISAQEAYRAGWFGHAALTATGAAQGDGHGAAAGVGRWFDRQSFDLAGFTAALQRAMDARSKTAKEVSAETGVSETTLSRMKSAERAPDAASLAALSAWAGLNPASFCGSGWRSAQQEAPAAQPMRLCPVCGAYNPRCARCGGVGLVAADDSGHGIQPAATKGTT